MSGFCEHGSETLDSAIEIAFSFRSYRKKCTGTCFHKSSGEKLARLRCVLPYDCGQGPAGGGGKVYRPGQPKTRSRFSLRRLFYANPLLSPPFAAAAASSPGRRREKEAPVEPGGGWDRGAGAADTCSMSSSILPGPSSASSSSTPPLFTDGATGVSQDC